MEIKMAAQTIRDTITMDQIINFYGYTVRHGFMICPFHGDKDASLKVYKGTGGWHCFGCGRGGSVIDFVMEHEGCSFQVAVRAIDETFSLGLYKEANPFSESSHVRIQRTLDDFMDWVNRYCNSIRNSIIFEMDILYRKMKRIEEKKADDPRSLTAAEWDVINSWKEESEYNDYKLEKVEQIREEAAAWRRTCRGTRARGA